MFAAFSIKNCKVGVPIDIDIPPRVDLENELDRTTDGDFVFIKPRDGRLIGGAINPLFSKAPLPDQFHPLPASLQGNLERALVLLVIPILKDVKMDSDPG